MRIIIVRHGEPNYEKDCLTPLGIRQAKAVAKRLADEGIEEIYSSPMGRARETAQETADLLGFGEVKIVDFMHELAWGTVGGPLYGDGHPWMISDEMVNEGWDLNRTDWKTHPGFINNRIVKEIEHVEEQTDFWLSTLGYQREGLYYRNVHEDDKQHAIALFCHGGSSTAMLARMLNLTFPYLCATLHLGHTGIATIRFTRRPGELCIPTMDLMGDERHKIGVD